MSIRLSSSLAILLLGLLSSAASTQHILTIAAASDLSIAQPALGAAFEKANPSIRARFVNGASAALAQQIQQGAPFDLFLSANTDLIDQLHLDSPKVYAVGHIAILWKDGKIHNLNDLKVPAVRFIALPNPRLAPYGLAAQQALQSSSLWDLLQDKIVYAENVSQTLQLFDSGNVEAALTALSLVVERHPQVIPSQVIQKAGIVPATKAVDSAKKFLVWLLSPQAQVILSRYGFSSPENRR